MKSLILVLMLLVMIGQAQANESEDLIAHQAEVHQAFNEADKATQQAYTECVESEENAEDPSSCVQDVLGDIYN